MPISKNQIIEQLYRSKEFDDAIHKMEPAHLRDDLKSEVIMILMETDDEKIRGLHDRDELRFYAARIICNQIQSNTSPFYKKYRNFLVGAHAHAEYNPAGDANVREQGCADEDFLNYDERVSKREPEHIDGHHERELKEQLEDVAMSEIDKLYWYNSDLVKLYLKHGTFRAIERETGIPHVSCYKTIKKSLDQIRNRLVDPAARVVPGYSRTLTETNTR